MHGRIYIWQDPAGPSWQKKLAEIIAVRSNEHCGSHIAKVRQEWDVYWDSEARVPWVQPDTKSIDGVLGFMRRMPEHMGISRFYVHFQVDLPLSAISSSVDDAIYGDEAVQARVTRFFDEGEVPVVSIEVCGTDGTKAADLFVAIKNGTAEILGGWKDRAWHADAFQHMRWELPEVVTG